MFKKMRGVLILIVVLMAAFLLYQYGGGASSASTAAPRTIVTHPIPNPCPKVDKCCATEYCGPSYLPGIPKTPCNPYANPMPYNGGVEVRSQKPKLQMFVDDSMQRIFKGTDVNSAGWYFNTIPDPTLMARPVYWTHDPRPDIVSKEADCSYRFCH